MNKVAEIRLLYRNKTKPKDRVKIGASSDVYSIVMDNWDSDTIELQEEFKCVLLNRANHVLGILNHSCGGTTGVFVDVKLLFAAAIKANASAMVIVHNHPSGNLKPSTADKKLTNKVAEVGRVLEITLLDHLIVTKEGYFSFSDDGIL